MNNEGEPRPKRRRLPRSDKCQCCGQGRHNWQCGSCGMLLCAAHSECPECDDSSSFSIETLIEMSE